MRTFLTTLIAGSLFAFSAMASALPLDFNIDFAGISGGSMTEVSGAVSGVGISIEVLSVSGAAGMVLDEVLEADITGGELNFDTAANTFVITGGIADLQLGANTVLFTSTVYDWTFLGGAASVFAASGTGFASDALLAALGEPITANPFAFTGFSVESLDGTLNSTDFMALSTGDRTVVPAPATLLLLGSGLLGMVAVGRRKAVQ